MSRISLRKPFLFSLSFLVGLVATLLAGERAQVTVLSTTDMHGHVLPVDYFTGKTDELGLAKVGTLIAQVRKQSPNALLIDVGDTIQGSPLQYVHVRNLHSEVDPMMLVMNHLRYDSMTVGNHEFNFGREVLDKARSEARFPWLSANLISTKTGEPLFTPYLIKQVDGVRVAILGITTIGIPHWEDSEHIQDIRFDDPVAVARARVAELRETQKADVVIVAAHMGLEEDLTTGARGQAPLHHENAVLEIAREVPGIDLMLLGHTHRAIGNLSVNGVLIAQAGRWADNLARADLYLEKNGQSWTILGKSSKLLPVSASVPVDPELSDLVRPYEQRTQEWLGRSIGSCSSEIDARDSRKGDNALIDLIHRVQLDAGKADISFAASFSTEARVKAGEVTVRDIYGLYYYENTLMVVEATGAQVKEALEHSARYFLPFSPGATLESLVNRQIPGYNFETAEGVSYTMDLGRPVGDRIVGLSFQGAPLDTARKFRVALNNYRFNGGGGYAMFKSCPVLERSSSEIRDLIIEWIGKNREIPTACTGNWSIRLPSR